MATKKDLVEAYSFSRRRLVTAFVSGAPGGREVEPARPGRMIVGGVALAVLLVAAGAVAGALNPRTDPSWSEPGLVTDDHGALYIILDESVFPGQVQLRSIINVTSAQLILGSDVKTKSVPDETLSQQEKGPQIGILDAPATVPGPRQLINSGWSSCTASGAGIRTEIAEEVRPRPADDQAFVVRAADSGKRYLIAEADVDRLPRRAYSYQLPADNDGLYDALRLSPNDEIEVPDEWLGLFPAGEPLDARGLGLGDLGAPAGLSGYTDGALVGDLYVRNNNTYVATRSGFVKLTPFAEAVLRNTPVDGKRRLPREITAGPGASFTIDEGVPYDASSWPEALPTGSVSASEEICGVLVTEEGNVPAVRLATVPAEVGMLEGVAAGSREVDVMSGHGALVRSADWGSTTGTSIYLIDDRGRSNSVAGAEEVERLGYDGVDKVVVPDSWNKLFRPGADLSVLAALCPPSAEPPPGGPSKESCS
ncbi:type VII secretion protein EccB [Nocardioides sp. zg-536]|uniref:Type VII secretion protein EccB n=1 Tax=Nocardioides faecalis TaxID=2803858 RepID=A0A938YD59_9ACTN|nr:type VII secretion protein EccB [Nocardioides faecalis]MBM9461689.1 type VII secretion protein EccB [Nocardioides faecalis]MBS4752105.1 type VII secretion protein EccB [Nocardioides faecalis]QVI59085.1 type VII secretion protein EccB [Nocardioides faecalis]